MGIKEFNSPDGMVDSSRRVFALDWSFCEEDSLVLPERRDDLEENPFFLKVFHINDLHGNIYFFDDQYNQVPVFSRIVREVCKERAASADNNGSGVLFLSAGDDSTGSPMDFLTGYDGENFVCHPAYTAYSIAELDATVPGNHDFDTGLSTLKKSIAESSGFPVLSANLRHNGELDGVIYPGAIIIVKGVRIGIIGLTTPGQIRSRAGSVFSIAEPLDSVKKMYSKLAPFCDSVIILSHLGYKLGSTFAAVRIMGDLELAAELEGVKIDLIVGGHTHDFLNINGLELKNITNNIPILQAGYNGLFYGKGILKISGTNSLVSASVLPTGTLSPDKDFDLEYGSSKAGQNISVLKRSVGTMDIDKLFRKGNYDILKDSFENPMANFITDALGSQLEKQGYNIDFTLIDSTSMMKMFDFTRNNVNIIDIYKLMPYADTVITVSLTGTLLEKLIMENPFRIDRDDEPNINRGFLHFSMGVRYIIDYKKRSVTDLTLNNIPVGNCREESFVLAMPNYVQGLSGLWEDLEAEKGIDLSGLRHIQKEDTGKYIRHEIYEYIRENGVSGESGFILDGRLKILK